MCRALLTSIGLLICLAHVTASASAAEDWTQIQFDARRSGNVPERSVATPLGLVGAVPLTDAVLTTPVVAAGRIYVVDAAGTATCIDARSLKVVWQFKSRGGPGDCNNISSPALLRGRLHYGIMAGSYYVLNAADGQLVKEIRCGEPVFTSPAIGNDRAYFATLGARVHAVDRDGNLAWTWDFVKEVIKFDGNRWSGEDWAKAKNGRVTWRDHFVCSRELGLFGKTVVIPAGGRTVFLEDGGDKPQLRAVGQIPSNNGNEYAAAFGQSIGEQGEVYVQWHRRDNVGRVEILRLKDGKVETDSVKGTQTAIYLPGLLSFCSVAIRSNDVYRCKPEDGLAFCKHSPSQDKPKVLGGYPSIAAPVLLKEQGIIGGLDGTLHVVPLSGKGPAWSFKTAFGKPITAPAAVCDGHIYFGSEDGYLYILGPDGKAALPDKELGLAKVRSPLTSKLADGKYDWFTNYGNQACTNASSQDVETPFKIRWLRRYEGTVKHLPVCGGGRMYTHTSEGQIFAIEQETGRLLWRRYWPGVHLSFTSPIYCRCREPSGTGATQDSSGPVRLAGPAEKLLVPQAGLKGSFVRCLDAATGKLLWEAPFSGSPAWSRQAPPIIHDGLAIYASGSGRYAPQGSEKAYVMSGTPTPSSDGAESHGLGLLAQQPLLPEGQQATDVGLGPGNRQGSLEERLLRVRHRRQRLRPVFAGRPALLLHVLRLCRERQETPRPAGRQQRRDHGPGAQDRQGIVADR